ncbi:MAG: cell division protein FtsL [Pseudomonadota bacterium]
MRGVIYSVSAMLVMGLAYWAYFENYRTQDALKEAAKLQRAIGDARETLSVLEAEWAYLNRPERLRDLANLNFETLELMPITSDHFADVHQVVAAPTEIPGLDLEALTGSVDVVGEEGQ